MNPIEEHIAHPERSGSIYAPIILRLSNAEDKKTYDKLLSDKIALFISDEIEGQLKELVKSQRPWVMIKPEEYAGLVSGHLNGTDIHDYGVWVYYPWSRRLVHLLDEDEFIEVRTNRNQYKITRQERDTLATKKIGIIGLSVGQSIALTLSMERGYGELRLADFDLLELSNLNRIRTGVHNLGVPKVVIAAREIAEIDPFLKVTCFFDGLTDANMEDFFTGGGKLDVLVDECDGLDIKILARYKARELRIPVVMDTSDRGMLDIERFDLEPDRPLLHGTVTGINPKNIKELSNEDKVPVILQMLGVDNISSRAKASMVEVQQSINTWPQLASSVALGGAAGADACRRILLDQFRGSGRYYIDFDEIVSEQTEAAPKLERSNPFQPLSKEEMLILAKQITVEARPSDIIPSDLVIQDLVNAACAAPSTGNDQPWKWLYHQGTLYLFHDEYRSFSFGDFRKIASYISFGAAYENLNIHALKQGLESYCKFVGGPDQKMVAAIRFKAIENKQLAQQLEPLDKAIYKRMTNRNQAPKTNISSDTYYHLVNLAESIPGAEVQVFTDEASLNQFAEIIGFCDRVRLLSKEGHYDFVHHEMRWTSEEAEKRRDGIDIKTLGLSNSQMAALGVIKSEQVISTINDLGGGKALDMLAKRTVSAASALCLLTLPKYELKTFFEGGRAMERFWLAATDLGLAVHPLISPLYLFPRIVYGNGEGIDPKFVPVLRDLRKRFCELTSMGDDRAEVFLAKIAIAPEPELKSFRLPLEKTLIIE
ncbi:MAG: Rv1355c family protein [Bacteroidetes bacterium]|jgi:molybdopterin/thiamine biosynthesis adenylyltransferase/nitroreductase|nr:Rv1355c family protein [Bacteroidota bacterium]